MIVTITPEDLIKRCLWNNYKKFILKNDSDEDIEKLVEENKPFAIPEDDAFVIGLLKIVQTDNIVHRFKQDMNEVIQIKSTIKKVENEKKVLINKSSIINDCINFKNHFPEYYKADSDFKEKIKELNEFINEKVKEIEEIPIIEIITTINNKKKKFIYVQSKEVSKLFKLNIIE
jgi:hypothetical protein